MELKNMKNDDFLETIEKHRQEIFVEDEENRTIMIGVSSEEPVERRFGMEVLGHNEDEIDPLIACDDARCFRCRARAATNSGFFGSIAAR